MSPHIRSMLDDAADDGGRPLALDLAAVQDGRTSRDLAPARWSSAVARSGQPQ